jgi:probable F420-dependent oxidoreductase
MPPRLNVGLSNYGAFLPPHDWRRLLDVAQAADDAGVDTITVVDHVVMGGDLSRYPYGAFPAGPDAPWLEPLTTLAAIAGRTTRVRLATGVLIAPLRPAAVLAKMAATLDVLSDGRLDLGVGTGWLDKEYEAAGLDFAQRGQLLDDTLAACAALWAGGAARFSSPRLAFDDVHCHPTPVQAGGVPIWIGGELHQRNLDRLVRHGRGWIPSPAARADADATGVGRLRAAVSAAGRDPADVRVRIALPTARDDDRRPDLARSLQRVPELLATGATDVYVGYEQFGAGPDDAPRFLAELAEGFRSALP